MAAPSPTPISAGDAAVARQKMLLAAQLSGQVKALLAKWKAGDLDLDELEFRLEVWFQDGERRRIFLTLIERSRMHKMDLLYGGSAAKFRFLLRVQLFSDFSERFANLHEAVSMLAWLVGTEQEVRMEQVRLPEALGLR